MDSPAGPQPQEATAWAPPAAERQLDQVMVAKLGSCPRSFDG